MVGRPSLRPTLQAASVFGGGVPSMDYYHTVEAGDNTAYPGTNVPTTASDYLNDACTGQEPPCSLQEVLADGCLLNTITHANTTLDARTHPIKVASVPTGGQRFSIDCDSHANSGTPFRSTTREFRSCFVKVAEACSKRPRYLGASIYAFFAPVFPACAQRSA